MLSRIFIFLLTLAWIPLSQATTLTIWIGADKGHQGLVQIGKQFEAELGVKVEIAFPDHLTEKFQQQSAAGSGPDIFIWAHDRFGDWARSGLLAAIEPGKKVRQNLEDYWQAVTYNGRIYGYPIAIEGPTLIYNRALISQPPKSFEFIQANKQQWLGNDVFPIMWDYNNAYFSYGVLSAKGGYVFAKEDQGWNPKVMGINNAGSIYGANLIKNLIDQQVMPANVDYGVMDSAFKAGQTAMIINGPWAWKDYEQAGIDFGIAPYPSVDGVSGRGFLGVLSAGINSASKNQELAMEFMEHYFLTAEGLKMVNDHKSLGVVTHKAFMAELAINQPRLKRAADIWRHYEPMPNVPEMASYWSNIAPALTAITSGRQSAESALNDVVDRMSP